MWPAAFRRADFSCEWIRNHDSTHEKQMVIFVNFYAFTYDSNWRSKRFPVVHPRVQFQPRNVCSFQLYKQSVCTGCTEFGQNFAGARFPAKNCQTLNMSKLWYYVHNVIGSKSLRSTHFLISTVSVGTTQIATELRSKSNLTWDQISTITLHCEFLTWPK